MILQAVQAVIVIFLIIGVGIFISWRKWVTREIAAAFPKIVINVAMPFTVIYSLSTNFTRQQLLDSWLPLLIVFIITPASFFIGRLAARVARIPTERRGVFTTLFALSNSVFIGFPVAQALFGENGMSFAVFYYLANTTVFWLLGYYAIRRDADLKNGIATQISMGEIVRKIATPPFVTVLSMFIIILSGLKLPSIILEPARYISGLTTPLSLIFMGCLIYDIGLRGLKYEKGIGPILAGRFLIIPAVCFALCTAALSIFPVGNMSLDASLMRNVFTVQMGLPSMTQTAIVAELYGADAEYATKSFVWTTAASLISIPAYMLLFQIIG